MEVSTKPFSSQTIFLVPSGRIFTLNVELIHAVSWKFNAKTYVTVSEG